VVFDEFVARHYARLVASFAYVRRDGIDPEDVVQETLLAVARRWDSLEFASDAHLWAYLRLAGTRLVGALVDAQRGAVPLTDMDAEVTELDPERVVLGRDALARVAAALSPSYLRVLGMAVDGLDSAEIAAALSLPNTQAANALLYRARVAARKEFGRVRHAALAPGLMRLRAMAADNAPVTAPAGVLASAVVLSLLVVVGVPPGFSTAREPGAASSPRAARPSLVIESAVAAGPGRPGRPSFGSDAPPHAAASVAAPDASPQSAAPLSPLTLTPPAAPCVKVCVQGPGQAPRGEVLRLKPLGPGAPYVAQDVTPLCHRVPDNPAVACERGQEPESWTVKELPPNPPEDPGGTA
jgi:DNA-directed RNA polymerase specialized sigma24 family protein